MGEVNYRVEIEHTKVCGAMSAVRDSGWEHPWGCAQGQVFRDKLGRLWKKHGRTTMWFQYGCGDPDCPATLLIRADHILSQAPAGEG